MSPLLLSELGTGRFREPHFEREPKTEREPSGTCAKSGKKLHVTCRFSVPGTNGNRLPDIGSRFPPPKGGNRYQSQPAGESR
jgi:hypothetical protein